MNKRMINGIFYLLMVGQALWWIRLVLSSDTFIQSRGHERHLLLREIDKVSEFEEPSKIINTLNLHLQKVNSTLVLSRESGQSNGSEVRQYYSTLLNHTILPRNCTLVLTGKYLRNPSTLCSRHQELDLLIIVHTAPYHFSRRIMIRQTMANNNLIRPYSVQPVFILGVMPKDKIDQTDENLLEKEFRVYGDIVQMDFDEDFRNLSLKAALWLRWTNEYCPQAHLVLKLDDDVVIDIYKLMPLSRGLFSKYKRSIFCNVNNIGTQPIPRIGRTKVDMREFTNNTYYPYTYCSGFIVFLSRDLIPLLARTIRQVPFYNVDDVFMFGMLPKFVGHVTYHNLGYNVSIWHKKVYNCTIERGTHCPYFGTMAEDTEDRLRVWQTMKKSHDHDFHFPHITIL